MSRLLIERGNEVLVQVPLDDLAVEGDALVRTEETIALGVQLVFPEANTAYRLVIGNVVVEYADARGADPTFAADRALWPDAAIFDSAAGRTWLHLESLGAAEDRWRPRARCAVDVVPAKLGEPGYRALCDDVAQVAPGLLLDVTGKSLAVPDERSLEAGYLGRLRAIESGWARLRRRAATPGSANLLRRRVRQLEQIERAAAADVARIENDRASRDFGARNRPSLYHMIDVPRLDRIRQVIARATELREELQALRRSAREAGRPRVRATRAGIQVVRAYAPSSPPARRTATAGIRATRFRGAFPGRPPAIAGIGTERIVLPYLKQTHRLYEQWVLFQVLAGMRAAGCQGGTLDALLGPATAAGAVDLVRGAGVVFQSPGGVFIRVRYEPWVHPRPIAAARGDSLFRIGLDSAPWSPDVLIEIVEPAARPGEEPTIEHAIVLDAKYVLDIDERHHSTVRRYFGIRALGSGEPIVREVWIAHPTQVEEEEVAGAAAVESDVPARPASSAQLRGARLEAVLPLTPLPRPATSAATGELPPPVASAVRFARRFLRTYGL